MTAAPLSLHSPGLSSETRASSSTHAKHAKDSAFQNEFAAQVADKGDKVEEPAKATPSSEPTSDKPTPESLLRASLMAQSSRPVEPPKANKQEELKPKPLPELPAAPALKLQIPCEGKTATEVKAPATAPKAKEIKAASHPEDNVIPQPDSVELSQTAAILPENAQAALPVPPDAFPTPATVKSVDKIPTEAIGTAAETADTSSDPQPAVVTGDLSLALKVSGDNGKAAAGHGAVANNAGLEAAANFRGQTHDNEPHADTSRGNDSAPLATVEAANAGAFKSEHAIQSETATTSTNAASQLEHAGDLEKLRNQSVHGVHVQVESTANGKLDIRMVERAGQLSVTMRSADPAVTRALQEHSSDLTTRLALEQYHTELWKPAAAESSNGKSSFQQSSEQNGSSGGKDDSNADRKRKNQNPQWVDEMEQTPLLRKVTTTI